MNLLTTLVTVCDDCAVSHCLDLYRTPVETADTPEDWPYTAVGQMVYRAKYRSVATDMAQLGGLMIDCVQRHACLRSASVVCAIPPSSGHGSGLDLPQQWAGMIGMGEGCDIAPLSRTRVVASQKGIADSAERRANQAGSMHCPIALQGKSALVVDDLYMEGETMSEAARALRAAGAGPVFGLCAVKTAKGTRGLDDLLGN